MSFDRSPRTAIVLAAGLGKRMRPVTETMPKPLVPVAGKPLIDHALDRLADAGIERAVVNVHYLADMLEAHLAQRTAPSITISDERERLLDSGGGFAKAMRLAGDEPAFLLNADTFWIDAPGHDALRSLSDAWDPERMDLLLLMVPFDRAVGHTGQGDFAIEADAPSGRLSWSKDGQVYAGAAIASPALLRGDEPEAYSFGRHFNAAMDAGRLYGVTMDGLWLTVGTPEAIGEAEAAVSAYRARSAA